MNPTDLAAALLDKASGHLHAAAEHADARAGGDAFSVWAALAGQLRLIAAGLSPTPAAAVVTPRPFGVRDHLDAAVTALDRIDPLDGPPDLQLWVWQVHDLRTVAASMDGDTGGGDTGGGDNGTDGTDRPGDGR